jgi:hypothetical protein
VVVVLVVVVVLELAATAGLVVAAEDGAPNVDEGGAIAVVAELADRPEVLALLPLDKVVVVVEANTGPLLTPVPTTPPEVLTPLDVLTPLEVLTLLEMLTPLEVLTLVAKVEVVDEQGHIVVYSYTVCVTTPMQAGVV